MTVTIRRADRSDAPLIVDFTHGLARYEGSLADVVATPDEVCASLFRTPAPAFCEIAEWDGEPAGFAIWSYNFSIYLGRRCLWLEDLFVAEDYRRRGIGRSLLHHLAAVCREESLGRMEWSVLQWNEDAMALYSGMGAKIDTGRSKCRWTADDLARLP